MDSVPINGVPGGGHERQATMLAVDYQRQLAARAQQVDLGREASRMGADSNGSGNRKFAFDFEYRGQPGRLVMKAGPRPGVVHVSVRVDAPLGEPDDHGPRLTLEADVSSQWMASVTRGASTQNEQAVRVAEALRDAGNGNGRTSGARAEVPVIRGPVRPQWPVVWLPAEYPPPPDDPSLIAQLNERPAQASGDR